MVWRGAVAGAVVGTTLAACDVHGSGVGTSCAWGWEREGHGAWLRGCSSCTVGLRIASRACVELEGRAGPAVVALRRHAMSCRAGVSRAAQVSELLDGLELLAVSDAALDRALLRIAIASGDTVRLRGLPVGRPPSRRVFASVCAGVAQRRAALGV